MTSSLIFTPPPLITAIFFVGVCYFVALCAMCMRTSAKFASAVPMGWNFT